MALRIVSIILGIVLLLMVVISCSFLTMTPFPRELMKIEDYVDLSADFPGDKYMKEDFRLFPLDEKVFLWAKGYDGNPDRILAFDGNLDFKVEGNGNIWNRALVDYDGSYILGQVTFNGALSFATATQSYFDEYPRVFYNSNYYYRMQTTDDPAVFYSRVDNAPAMTFATDDYIAMGKDLCCLDSVFIDPAPTFRSAPSVCLIFKTNNNSARAFLLELDKLRTGGYSSLGVYLNEGTLSLYLPESDDDFYYYARAGVVTLRRGEYYLYTFDGKLEKLTDSEYYNKDYIDAYDSKGEYFYRFYMESKRLTKNRVWWQ